MRFEGPANHRPCLISILRHSQFIRRKIDLVGLTPYFCIAALPSIRQWAWWCNFAAACAVNHFFRYGAEPGTVTLHCHFSQHSIETPKLFFILPRLRTRNFSRCIKFIQLRRPFRQRVALRRVPHSSTARPRQVLVRHPLCSQSDRSACTIRDNWELAQ